MRKVIVQEFVSLDGFAADRGGGVDYVPASTQGDEGFGRDQLALFESIDAILLGRNTYGMFAGYWPHVTDEREKPFADKMNSTPKFVFSKTLDRAPWGPWTEAAIVRGGAEDEVAKLKTQPGKDMILWGSLSLAQSLIGAGLVDEYRLVVCPVVLGSGRSLFAATPRPLGLRLGGVKAHDRGAVSLTYVPLDGPPAPGR